MGIHLTIFGVANTIGAAAVPSTTTNAVGNIGSIATCTLQGFLIYVTFLTACSYYVSFSFFSYVGTINNFEHAASIEWRIHIFVHVYPVISGVYNITQEVFNNSGFGYCFLEVDPIGCGVGDPDEEGFVPCERGPASQREVGLIGLFWTVFLFIIMLTPTAVMTTLYFKVKANQSTIPIPAKEVAKQSAAYLLVLYAGIFPSALVHSLEFSDSSSLNVTVHLFSDIMFMLFGLLSIMFYLYITTGDWVAEVDVEVEDDESEVPDQSTDFIFGQLGKALKREGTGSGDIVDKPKSVRQGQRKSISRRQSSRFSFNIFDGTNAAGQFADFIFDGDSADLRADHAETEKWNAVQDHI